jgi:hypothetical protein
MTKKKIELQPRPKVKLSQLNDLPDYQAGITQLKKNDKLYIIRTLNDKLVPSSCIVKDITGNVVTTWDESHDHFFSFSISGDDLTIKMVNQ